MSPSVLDTQASLTDGAILSVRSERKRQDEKWGPSMERPSPSLAVLMEEVGEVANALLENDEDNLRVELVQVAAVALAMVEAIDRGEPPVH